MSDPYDLFGYEDGDEEQNEIKYQSRQNPTVTQFLEIEAEEDGDDLDDIDDDLDFEDGFLDDSSVPHKSASAPIFKGGESLDGEFRKKRRTDGFQAKLGELESRYAEDVHADSNSELDQRETEGIHDAYEPKNAHFRTEDSDPLKELYMQPTNSLLWWVRVARPGAEKEVCLNVMKKYRSLTAEEKRCFPIASVTSTSSVHGNVYIETAKSADITEFLKDIPMLVSNNIKLVNAMEVNDVITADNKGMRLPVKGSWVRMIRGDCSGAIGIVSDANESRATVTVRLFPQINLDNFKPGSTAPSSRKGNRGPPRLISLSDLQTHNIDYEYVTTFTNAIKFKNFLIEESTGLLLKTLKHNSLCHDTPTKEELTMWLNTFSNLTDLIGAPVCTEATFRCHIVIGQPVVAVSGDMKGVKGVVTAMGKANIMRVQAENEKSYEIESCDLRKVFNLGDNVRIAPNGDAGLLIALEGNKATILDTDSHVSYESDINDLIIVQTGNITGTTTSLGGFSVGEFVVMDGGHDAGIIARIFMTKKFEIMSTSGLRRCSLIEIAKNRNTFQATATDIAGNEYSTGATVKIESGQFEGVTGTVKHIWRDWCFLQCDSSVHTNGYICIETNLARISTPENAGALPAAAGIVGANRSHYHQIPGFRSFSVAKQKQIMGTEVKLTSGLYKGMLCELRALEGNEAVVLIRATGCEVRVPKRCIELVNSNSQLFSLIRGDKRRMTN